MGGPYGLDFGSVMVMGEALGVDAELLAEVLPGAEEAILSSFAADDDDAEG